MREIVLWRGYEALGDASTWFPASGTPHRTPEQWRDFGARDYVCGWVVREIIAVVDYLVNSWRVVMRMEFVCKMDE